MSPPGPPCKMGPIGDPSSAVHPQLCELGTDRLMVAYASIFPNNSMFNTNLTGYMVGEIAAALIAAA